MPYAFSVAFRNADNDIGTDAIRKYVRMRFAESPLCCEVLGSYECRSIRLGMRRVTCHVLMVGDTE